MEETGIVGVGPCGFMGTRGKVCDGGKGESLEKKRSAKFIIGGG